MNKNYQRTKMLLRPCPVCGSEKGEVLHTQKFLLPPDHPLPAEYDVVACSQCGFTYADTDAGQQAYDRYYQILSIYEENKTGRGSASGEYDLNRVSETAEEVARTCPDKTARIIDIGCATGGILKALQRKGYTDLTGVDLSAKCVENIVSCGIVGKEGTVLEVGRLFEQKFDYVILSHIMEHVYDLKKALRQCHDLMNEGALLYIEVPDAAHYADFYIAPYDYINTEHINHFDEVSLVNLGAVAGFAKRYVAHKTLLPSSGRRYPAVSALFEKVKMPDRTIHVSTKARESIERWLELSANDSCTKTIAELVKTQEEMCVFGVGNITCNLLATSDLPKCNIRAFIDNDPKKATSDNSLNYSEKEFMCGGKMLINKHIYMPKVLAGFTGTVLITSILFAHEIEAQVKSINKNLKIIKFFHNE